MKTRTIIRSNEIFKLNYSRQTKEKYFSGINVKSICDKKKFWKTIKPYFANEGLITNNIRFVENKRIVLEQTSSITVSQTLSTT